MSYFPYTEMAGEEDPVYSIVHTGEKSHIFLALIWPVKWTQYIAYTGEKSHIFSTRFWAFFSKKQLGKAFGFRQLFARESRYARDNANF